MPNDNSPLTTLPDNNIIEITLIGTGGGYGESVVAHLGNNNWMVVDSCIDPENKICLPLKFLQDKGVNIAENLKVIVCTHWHEDHTNGMDQLVSEAKNAE